MKKIIALLLTAVMLVGLVACASKTTDTPKEETTTESTETAKTEETATKEEPAAETETPETTEERPLTIGLSMYTLEYPFYVTMCDAFEAACEEKGWTCITTNASTDASTQPGWKPG